MASSDQRSDSWVRDYALATGTGALYGATNTLVGHPFDTVKTKMQAQTGFAGGMRSTMSRIVSTEGLLGFYHGCIPPLWGSAIYRSAQFAVYDLLYTAAASQPALCEPLIPGVTDMEARVPLAGCVGATARTILESPIEYAKVKGQTGQAWLLREIYQGAHLQVADTPAASASVSA